MRHRGDRQRCSIENAGSMSGSPPCRTSSSEAVQSVGAVLSGARAPSAMSCGSWWSTCPRTRSLLCCPRHVGIWPRRRRGPGRRRSSVPGVPVGVTWPSGPRNFSTTASAALRDPLRHGPDRGRRSRRRRSPSRMRGGAVGSTSTEPSSGRRARPRRRRPSPRSSFGALRWWRVRASADRARSPPLREQRRRGRRVARRAARRRTAVRRRKP
jgi:hypothetical protein